MMYLPVQNRCRLSETLLAYRLARACGSSVGSGTFLADPGFRRIRLILGILDIAC